MSGSTLLNNWLDDGTNLYPKNAGRILLLANSEKINADYNTSGDLADTTRIYDLVTTVDVNQTLAISDGISNIYGAINWTAGGNGSAILQGVEGVARSQSADEALTIRGGYFRTYIAANADSAGSTARTSVGCEISARAGYAGGNAVAPEAGTAFVGARIWMAPYFASDYANINNFHGLWIYNEHTTQAVTNGIKIDDAGGGYTNDINFQSGDVLRNGTAGTIDTDSILLSYGSALGTTTSPRISLINATAAAAGAQQVSPSLYLRGNGWKTDATAESEPTDWQVYVLPVEGTSAPTSSYVFQSRINNGAWGTRATISSGGTIQAIGNVYAGLGGSLTFYGATLNPSTGSLALNLKGNMTDGATAYGVKIGNRNALSTAGSKIAGFFSDDVTTEKSYVSYQGGYFQSQAMALGTTPSIMTLVGENTTAAEVGAQQVSPAIQLYGRGWETAVGSSQTVGWQMYVLPVQGTANSPVLVFQSKNSTAGSFADRLTISGAGSGTFSGTVAANNKFTASSANLVILEGRVADGATAIAIKFQSANALSTAGAKISSWYSDSGTTERAYVDYLGSFNAGPGTTLLPAYSFLGDPNTGIWNSTANGIGFSTDGITRMALSTTALTFTSTGITGLTTLGMGGDLTNYEATNDGNPSIFLGSAAAERFEVQSVYDGGAQTLNYVQFQTYAASATADKGKYIFGVDGTDILTIDDGGLELAGGITISAATIGLSIGNCPTGIVNTDVGATGEHFLDMVNAYTGLIIETGTYSSSASQGVTINATNSRPASFLFDDAGLALGAGDIRPTLSRTAFTVDQTTAGVRFAGLRGHIKAASGVDFSGDTSEYYATQGIIEAAGATTIGAGAFAAGVCGMIWADDTFTGTGMAAGVMAKLYQTAGSTTTTSAFAATKWWNSNDTWSNGLYIQDASVDTGHDIRMQGGALIGSGTDAPTHSATQGSMYIRTGQTINATIYINTDGGTTWTLCNSIQA